MTVAARLTQALSHRPGWDAPRLQRALASRGVLDTLGVVNGYVSGTQEPSKEWLLEAAKMLEVRPEWLLTGDGPMTEEPSEERDEEEAAKERAEAAPTKERADATPKKGRVDREPKKQRGETVAQRSSGVLARAASEARDAIPSSFGRESLDITRDEVREVVLPTLEKGAHDDPRVGHQIVARRLKAMYRFATKLNHARVADSSWRPPEDRRRLLVAAARFLVKVERAFADVTREPVYVPTMATDENGSDAADDVTMKPPPWSPVLGEMLVEPSLSEGWYVTWSDAVLDLFARRVRGLGERTGTQPDAHNPGSRPNDEI